MFNRKLLLATLILLTLTMPLLSRATEPLVRYLGRICEEPLSPYRQWKIQQLLARIFGAEAQSKLTDADWPYEVDGFDIRLLRIDTSKPDEPPSLVFHLEARDPLNKRIITDDWFEFWSLDQFNQRPELTLGHIRTFPEYRNSSFSIGRKLIEKQLEFLKKFAPRKGILSLSTVKVGNYAWATRGFEFNSPQVESTIKRHFKTFLKSKDLTLTEKELALFNSPHHYAAFTDGSRSVVDQIESDEPLLLTPQQLQSKSLSGVPGEYPLIEREILRSKTSRLVVHLGKEFLLSLGRLPGNHSPWRGYGGWAGIIDLAKMDSSEAMRFAELYPELKENGYKALSPAYQELIQRLICERKLTER